MTLVTQKMLSNLKLDRKVHDYLEIWKTTIIPALQQKQHCPPLFKQGVIEPLYYSLRPHLIEFLPWFKNELIKIKPKSYISLSLEQKRAAMLHRLCKCALTESCFSFLKWKQIETKETTYVTEQKKVIKVVKEIIMTDHFLQALKGKYNFSTLLKNWGNRKVVHLNCVSYLYVLALREKLIGKEQLVKLKEDFYILFKDAEVVTDLKNVPIGHVLILSPSSSPHDCIHAVLYLGDSLTIGLWDYPLDSKTGNCYQKGAQIVHIDYLKKLCSDGAHFSDGTKLLPDDIKIHAVDLLKVFSNKK